MNFQGFQASHENTSASKCLIFGLFYHHLCLILGNEKMDSHAKVGAMEGGIYDRQMIFCKCFVNSSNGEKEIWDDGEEIWVETPFVGSLASCPIIVL